MLLEPVGQPVASSIVTLISGGNPSHVGYVVLRASPRIRGATGQAQASGGNRKPRIFSMAGTCSIAARVWRWTWHPPISRGHTRSAACWNPANRRSGCARARRSAARRPAAGPGETRWRRRGVGHRGQQPGDDHGVERAVRRRKLVRRASATRIGPGRPGPPRPRGGAGTARVRPRRPPDRGRIVREVQAVARADLQHPAGQPGQHLLPELLVAAFLVPPAEPGEVPREKRIVHQRHA